MSKIRKRKISRSKKAGQFTINEAQEIVLSRKSIEGLRSETLRNYSKVFKHLQAFFNDVSVGDITESDAKDFILFLVEKDIANSTINSYLHCLRAIFKTLEEEELATNVFKNIKRLKTDQKHIEILTISELKKLLKAIDQSKYNEFRDFVLINVLLDTMGRIQETIKLKVSDVDFTKHTITFNETKSRKARLVPVGRNTLKLLRELIKENEEFDTDNIFLSVTGEPITKSAREISTKLKVYGERAGLNKRIHFHLFRHTAASHFLKESKNIRLLQKLLGHSDISITQRYAHVLDEDLYREAEEYSIVKSLTNKKKLSR
ncbi:hypothetical protein BTR22_05215 [Alkalihalophilus pseudofirmus]|uniref:tyrosine-type recombinase/integrase n=1 Tax=Alkalihalophilus pseudofirmus TaxID=79885 RepID=UPI0009527E85|nr:hypothetical protein BTR22_05215 [Alkalihalophilus pseudofirmus]